MDIRAFGLVPGSTYYMVIVNVDEKYWNGTTFETFASGNWSTYATGAAVANAAGDWFGTFPTAITTPGTYTVQLRLREGVTAALTDDLKAGPGEYNWSGTAEIVSAGEGMTVDAARTWLARTVRDGTDDTLETTEDLDRALMLAGNHFCRTTKYVKRTDSVAITSGSTSFPLTSPESNGFLPERILDVWLNGEEDPLQLVDYHSITRLAARSNPAGGTPTHIAFLDTNNSAIIYPTPDANYTARLRWVMPFTSWVVGATDSLTLNTQVNLPDDVMQQVIVLGAAGTLKLPSKENTRNLWQEFLEYCKSMRGTGHLGARIIQRDPGPRNLVSRRDIRVVVE